MKNNIQSPTSIVSILRDNRIILRVASIFLFLLMSGVALASHLRSGEIIYKRLPPFTNSNFTYSITVIKYFDYGGAIADRCVDTIYFGDGTKAAALRSNGSTFTASCGANVPDGELISLNPSYMVRKSVYGVVHQYSGPGTFTISSTDFNRTGGILNMSQSQSEAFYLDAVLVISANQETNNSPVFTKAPLDRAYINTLFQFSPCMYDAEGDSLSYELINCRGVGGQVNSQYSIPAFSPGGTIGINPISGVFSWNVPPVQGRFQIAFRIHQWHKTNCVNLQYSGYCMRDMELVVSASSTYSGSGVFTPAQYCLLPGGSMSLLNILYIPVPNYSSTVLGASENPAIAASITNTNATVFATYTSAISYTAACGHSGPGPVNLWAVYEPSVAGTAPTYYQPIQVNVSMPPPTFTAATVSQNNVFLQWSPPPVCNSLSVQAYHIYRSLSGPAPSCFSQTFFGGFLPLLATVSGNTFSYNDGNLWNLPNGSSVKYWINAVMNNCSNTRTDSVQVSNLMVGLKQLAPYKSLLIFPQPVISELTVTGINSDSKKVFCRIYSAEGQLLQNHEVTAEQGQVRLPMQELPPGLYFLELEAGGHKYRQKIVK